MRDREANDERRDKHRDRDRRSSIALTRSMQCLPTPVVTARDGIFAERGGRRLLSFSCNDYLNLSRHPAIIKAAVEATQRYGVGAGASRLSRVSSGGNPFGMNISAFRTIDLAGLKASHSGVTHV